MKKLSFAKTIIGLFVALAVSIGLTACDVGEYVGDGSAYTALNSKTTIKLLSGNKYELTTTFKLASAYVVEVPTDYTDKGRYKIEGFTSSVTRKLITFTSTEGHGSDGPHEVLNGKFSLSSNWATGGKITIGTTDVTKRSIEDEAVEADVEFAGDLSPEELEALEKLFK